MISYLDGQRDVKDIAVEEGGSVGLENGGVISVQSDPQLFAVEGVLDVEDRREVVPPRRDLLLVLGRVHRVRHEESRAERGYQPQYDIPYPLQDARLVPLLDCYSWYFVLDV